MNELDLLLQNEFIKTLESKIKILESELFLYKEMLEEKIREHNNNTNDEIIINYIWKLKDKITYTSSELEIYNKIYEEKVTNVNNLKKTFKEDLLNYSQRRMGTEDTVKKHTTPKKNNNAQEQACITFEDGTTVCPINRPHIMKRTNSNSSQMKGKVKPVEYNRSFCSGPDEFTTSKWGRI